MWEIGKGDVEYLYVVELVPLEDVGLREPELSNVSETLDASSTLHFLGVR